MYKWNGWDFYNKILQSGKYLAYNQELELIDKHRQELQKYIKKYITDIWCGNWEKAIHLLENDSSINDIFYVASDYSASMIEATETNINMKLPDIKMGNHQIMRWWNELFTNSLDNNTYLRLWCTIWNLANKQEIVNQIKNMNNSWTLKWNKIIFSYFDIPQTPQELDQTTSLYKNKEWKDFILNWLKNLWIDTNKFEHIVDYNPNDNCIYIWAQAKEDYEIIMTNWRNIKIKQWEKYYVHKSKRFNLEEINQILKQSWAKIEKHIWEDWISLIIAQKDPKYYKKTLKIIWLTSLVILWILWWAIWYKTIENYKKKERTQEIAKEKIEKYDINFRLDWHKTRNITSLEEKEHYLQNIAQSFSSAYWTWELNYQDIYCMIIDSYWPNSFTYQTYWKDKFQKFNFINRQLIADNEVELQNSWIDLEPYKGLSEYEDALINSRLDTTNIQAKYSDAEQHRWWQIWNPAEINKIWEYTTIHWTVYEIWYITRNRDFWKNSWSIYSWDFSMWKYKKYILAKIKYDKDLWISDKFSIKNAKYVCEDYFLWTRPQIQTTYDIIKICCKIESAEWYYTEQQIDEVQELILNYFIKNKISRGMASKYLEDIYPPDLLDFVYNKLLKDEAKRLKEIWINPVPYSIFYEFIDAFQNTQEYRDLWNEARWKNDFLVPTHKDLSKYNEKYIWEYIDQEWNSFGVSYITVEWKRYIIANERNDKYSNWESCIIYWTQVREDFQKNILNKK